MYASIDSGPPNIQMPSGSRCTSPDFTNGREVHTAFFFSTPGSVYRATRSGTWGDAREASVEYGARYLDVVEAATLRMLEDVDKTFAAMPPR